jgi:uncharacterized protein YlxW (UPF0749 family)
MAAMQEELKAQTPDEEQDELYEEEPRRRPWAAITSLVLALAVIFVGYQWHQASAREQAMAAQAHALRAEAETLRLRADDTQRDLDALQKRFAALGAERSALAERVAALEKAQERSVRAAEPRSPGPREKARARVTPVVQKKPR